MKIKYFLLFVLAVMLLQIGCGTSAVNSQTTTSTNINTVAERYHPKDEARIESEFERLKWDGINKEELMKQPAPQFVMVFKCQEAGDADCINGEFRQRMPKDAQELVDKYWQQLLDYSFVMETDKRTSVDAETNRRLSDAVTSAYIRFSNPMQEISVSAPNGERKMSYSELNQITDSLNDFTCQTVQQSDVCKFYDPETKEWRVKNQ